jgi:Zn-dependent M28 family amino/carboxypeptidase
MRQTVKYLCEIKPARNYQNHASLEKAVQYIVNQFKECGLTPAIQKFKAAGNEYKNVIASIGPEKGSRIIVGAHYDVCGDQPGADDNASGIAGLLEMAKYAQKNKDKLKYRVDFVAYCLEEPPFFGSTQMGSYIHAASLHQNKVKVHGMIVLDMVGFFSDKEDSQQYPLKIIGWFFPDKADFISIIGNFSSRSLVNAVAGQMATTGIKVETLKAPSAITGVDFSDHRNYWHFDYDAVMITDTAFYRNRNYHKTTDTIDTLDFKRMKQVVQGLCRYLLNAD